MNPIVRSCAIYTRKSSEEGLDMEFNSLDAQREACAAYIASQKSEGWIGLKTHYDDGGFSGGNIERPGLKQLIADIELGKVHIVVVYKIDRLTRSLTDFSKLVETFDKYGVTFVSVTQSFNTTTSMGRLTLNVLLSFAQFEREVTGERIRDKIAASKQKGIWMGGVVPIGYLAQDRKLIPDPQTISIVQNIFERYLSWGSIAKLKAELDQNGILSRTWTSRRGNAHECASFSRGILYKILKNPVYIGKIVHREKIYDGQHEAIIDPDLWSKVQFKLAHNTAPSRRGKNIVENNLLKGLLFDMGGNPYSPTYTQNNGKRYRYYIAQNLLQYRDHPKGVIARLPAQELEDLLCNSLKILFEAKTLECLFGLEENNVMIRHIVEESKMACLTKLLSAVVSRVTIQNGSVAIKTDVGAFKKWLSEIFSITISDPKTSIYDIEVPFVTGRSRTGTLILNPLKSVSDVKDPFDRSDSEIRDWVQGVIWRSEHFQGMTLQSIADREGLSPTNIVKYINKSLSII